MTEPTDEQIAQAVRTAVRNVEVGGSLSSSFVAVIGGHRVIVTVEASLVRGER